MTEPLDDADFQLVLVQLPVLAQMLVTMPNIDGALMRLSRAEDTAPFLDPTLFQKYLNSDRPKKLKRLLEVAAAFQHEAREQLEAT